MFPSYFCPMLLCDPARRRAYDEALRAAVRDFRECNGGRAPRVLDLGTGTGLLGYLALRAGAAEVVSVDENEACVDTVREVAKAAASDDRWTVAHTDDLDDAERFDMIVSEILGTVAFVEGMHEALLQFESMLRTDVVGGPYLVPRRVEQYVARATLPSGAWLQSALLDTLRATDHFVGTNALNLHPACTDMRVLDRRLLYTLDYRREKWTEESHRVTFDADADTPALLLCEWRASLWGDVELENTLDGYRALPFANAVGRECAWGFAVTAAPAEPVTVHVVSDHTGMHLMTSCGKRGLAVGAGVSLAALLPFERVEAEVRAAVANVAAGEDVLVETRENACLVPFVEALCAERGLQEPWEQDDVSEAWTMRNPTVHACAAAAEAADDAHEGTLGVAILPDLEGERASEAACRCNDDRFACEKGTIELVRELVEALGGDAGTATLPAWVRDATDAAPLAWREMVYPLDEDDDAMRMILFAPLRALHGYAALTRHGMLDDDCMPGTFMQPFALFLRHAYMDTPGVRVAIAGGGEVCADSTLDERLRRDGAAVREEVSAMCTGGRAIRII